MKQGITLILAILMAAATAGQSNVLGMPVYYDQYGNPVGTPAPADSSYHLPKHHYLNDPVDDFCSFFFEPELMLGTADWALGANLTYLPERWGLYGSALFGGRRNYYSVGPALRLGNSDNFADFHLYAGAVFSRFVGAEAGLRIAEIPRSGRRFCWSSGSVGVMYVNGHTFFTCGLSLEVLAVTWLTMWL